MSTLQLGLIVAGVALVIGVILYNAWQERRARRRSPAAFKPEDKPAAGYGTAERVEPTLGGRDSALHAAEPPPGGTAAVRAPTELPASPFTIPMDDVALPPANARDNAVLAEPEAEAATVAPLVRSVGPQPDPDIECMVGFAPAQPIAASALAAGLHVRLGKPLRWFGRT